MSIGDGLVCLAVAVAVVGVTWAVAWSTVRSLAIRAEAVRRPGEATSKKRPSVDWDQFNQWLDDAKAAADRLRGGSGRS